MSTTNNKYGITNADRYNSTFGTYVAPIKTYTTDLFDDFNTLITNMYKSTIVGTGTTALANTNNGVLTITNSAANNDSVYLQYSGGTAAVVEPIAFVSGQRLWFEGKFQVSNATNTALVFGLQITDTTPEAVSDGVWFSKAAASTSISINAAASSVQTTQTGVATLANATDITLGFFYNGVSSITYYVNGVQSGSLPITNLPTHTLTLSFGVRNGTAAATTMSVDYIYATAERNQTLQVGN